MHMPRWCSLPRFVSLLVLLLATTGGLDVVVSSESEAAGRQLYDAGEYAKAIATLEKGVNQLQQEDESSWAQNTIVPLLIGVYKAQAKEQSPRDALQTHKKALDLSVARYGEDDVPTAIVRNEIAAIYGRAKGMQEEACRIYKKNLLIFDAAPEGERINAVETITNMANVYDRMGQREEAIRWYEKVLNRVQEANDKDKTSTIMSNLAILLRKSERYDEAIARYEAALKANNDSPILLRGLAKVYSDKKEYREAIRILDEALQLQQEDSQEAAQTLTELGIEKWRSRKPIKALQSFKQAWEMRRKVLGDDHVECGRSLLQIASIFMELKQWMECEQYFIKSQLVLQGAVGAAHANTQLAVKNAQICRQELKKKQEEAELEVGNVGVGDSAEL